jgi:hypothetical protein
MVVWNSAKNPPKTNCQKFLVLVKNFVGEGLYHNIATYVHDSWYGYDPECGYYEIDDVEFWMELPEPPKELS